MSNNILYEHPLSERYRTFMRLEYLFNKIDHFSINKTGWEMFIAIQTLIEIINIMERNDILLDIIKELDRYQVTFSKLLDIPTVDKETLSTTLTSLEMQLNSMQTNASKDIKLLRNDELLTVIRQKMSLTNNLCSFDMPGMYYWLHQNNDMQLQQFYQWLEKLATIKTSIKLILQLIKESSTFTMHTADCGFYQTAFKHNTYYQIIRIKLPNTSTVFPEISGNKHRITVRFLAFSGISCRPQQTKENIDFELSCCYL